LPQHLGLDLLYRRLANQHEVQRQRRRPLGLPDAGYRKVRTSRESEYRAQLHYREYGLRDHGRGLYFRGTDRVPERSVAWRPASHSAANRLRVAAIHEGQHGGSWRLRDLLQHLGLSVAGEPDGPAVAVIV